MTTLAKGHRHRPSGGQEVGGQQSPKDELKAPRATLQRKETLYMGVLVTKKGKKKESSAPVLDILEATVKILSAENLAAGDVSPRTTARRSPSRSRT